MKTESTGYVILNDYNEFWCGCGYHIWHEDLNRAHIFPDEKKANKKIKLLDIKNLTVIPVIIKLV